MTARTPVPVVLLPGILMPAALRYAPLLEALGSEVRAVTKDLEVYGGGAVPPPGYSLRTELDGITRAADEAGFGAFHLYGHSGGGACAIAFTASNPGRVLSLALDEPAVDFGAEDTALIRDVFLPMMEVPPEEQLGAFVRSMFRSDVEPPPPPSGPPPPWMRDRPAGIVAFVRALADAGVPIERLREFERPVYYSYGSLSNEDWERRAERLAAIFPSITVERYEGLSHMNASHVAEPERVAGALRRLWGIEV
jgi:pimeloyl-ACP methyl ester carboxylesterase